MSTPSFVPGEADGLTKAEADTMAFLARAGAVPSAKAPPFVPGEANGLTKAEADTMAFLARAGAVPSASTTSTCSNLGEAQDMALLARAGFVQSNEAPQPQQGSFHR